MIFCRTLAGLAGWLRGLGPTIGKPKISELNSLQAAAGIVLGVSWMKITCTPVDISVETCFTPKMGKPMGAAGKLAANRFRSFILLEEGGTYGGTPYGRGLDRCVADQEICNPLRMDVGHGPEYRDTLA